MKKRTIWTMVHNAFSMGGISMEPIKTEVTIIEEKTIGKGYNAFSFETPKGTVRIAESTTGAVISSSFKEAMKDVESASSKVINKQLEEAKMFLQSKDCKSVSNKEFFKKYNY